MSYQHLIPIPIDVWTANAKKHSDLMGVYADAFVARRGKGQSHPVHDFMFTYYSCSPTKLKQWVPSFQQELVVTPELMQEYPWLKDYWFIQKEDLLTLNKERIQENTIGIAKFIINLCENILQQAPRFGCYGLHEWAMVYKLSQEQVRHTGHRLRLAPEDLARFVQQQTICCSHYDAYRFFTEEAKPLNVLNPTLASRIQMEQGGCLHANMDLYKWATKLWPWIGSDFIAKTFLLAFEIRELDMRASPYDLLDEGYSPICIETEEGRKLYQQEQQNFASRSTGLRQELLEFCSHFLADQLSAKD